MKKILGVACIIIFLSVFLPTSNAEIDISDWGQYNGYSTFHSFSIRFPDDWKSITSGENLQAFLPKDSKEQPYFSIKEFEGHTYNLAINYYEDEENELVEIQDIILSHGDDIVAKRVIFKNMAEDKSYAITFVKRGTLIVALTEPNLENHPDFPVPSKYNEIVKGMYDSFKFSDNWHQYIDYGENYTFIFPSSWQINTTSDGVGISDPTNLDEVIFNTKKYGDIALEEAPDHAEGNNEDLKSREEIVFHDLNALTAVYEDKDENKDFSRIFVENNGSSYSLTNTNIEANFPHLDYYDDYIIEILESVEFFKNTERYYGYKHFSDIRDNHPNAEAINSLAGEGIIAGYPDGTFGPDAEINRAELTKMIVATVADPLISQYSNCFPDVEEQWFAPFICYALEQGWVEGYDDGYFRPEQNINRAEALKIMGEVLFENLNDKEPPKSALPADISIEDWYGRYFIFADNRSLLDKQHIQNREDGTYLYKPSENISRKEVAETIYRDSLLDELIYF